MSVTEQQLNPRPVEDSWADSAHKDLRLTASSAAPSLMTPLLRANHRIYLYYPWLNIDSGDHSSLKLCPHLCVCVWECVCVCSRAKQWPELWPHSTPTTEFWSYGGECQNLQGRSARRCQAVVRAEWSERPLEASTVSGSRGAYHNPISLLLYRTTQGPTGYRSHICSRSI